MVNRPSYTTTVKRWSTYRDRVGLDGLHVEHGVGAVVATKHHLDGLVAVPASTPVDDDREGDDDDEQQGTDDGQHDRRHHAVDT